MTTILNTVTRDQMSERTERRRSAEARALDMTLFPRWLNPGTLSIHEGGTKRRIDKIGINEKLTDEE